jgi:hypothetical protein
MRSLKGKLFYFTLFKLNNISLHSTINGEKKSREETEEAILEMLRIMITKMKGDIESERKDRYNIYFYF